MNYGPFLFLVLLTIPAVVFAPDPPSLNTTRIDPVDVEPMVHLRRLVREWDLGKPGPDGAIKLMAPDYVRQAMMFIGGLPETQERKIALFRFFLTLIPERFRGFEAKEKTLPEKNAHQFIGAFGAIFTIYPNGLCTFAKPDPKRANEYEVEAFVIHNPTCNGQSGLLNTDPQ